MKRIVLLYFSGTGNTKFVAECIGNEFRRREYEIGLISMEDKERIRTLDMKDTIMGIGFPCYALSYPDIVGQAITGLPAQYCGTPAFVFSTAGWGVGNSMKRLAVLLQHKGLCVIKACSFICPNNGWITLFSPASILCRHMKYENRLWSKIQRFVDDIIQSEQDFDNGRFSISTVGFPLVTLLGRLLENAESHLMNNYRIIAEKCRSCGMCIRNCPVGNIEADEHNNIAFTSRSRCIHCLRCISDCPSDAIRLGTIFTGKGWYTKQLRAEFRKTVKLERNE